MDNKAPDHFDQLLHSWTETPAPSGCLTAPVWQRIEARGMRLPWSERTVDFLRELDLRFARPQAMAALAAVALLLGFGVAAFETRRAVARVDAEMSARYLALLTPTSR